MNRLDPSTNLDLVKEVQVKLVNEQNLQKSSEIETFFTNAGTSASVLKQFAEVTTSARPANDQLDSLDRSDDDEIEIRLTEVHELEDTYGDLSNAEQSKQFTESEYALCALNDIGGYITNQSDSVSKLSQPSTEQKIDIVKIGACQPHGPCVKFPKIRKSCR